MRPMFRSPYVPVTVPYKSLRVSDAICIDFSFSSTDVDGEDLRKMIVIMKTDAVMREEILRDSIISDTHEDMVVIEQHHSAA